MRELSIINARVLTMDPGRPRATALLIKGDRILAVGAEEDLNASRTSAGQVIDLGGRALLPGFIDAHLHLRGLAESLVTLNVGPSNGISSISDIQDRIRDAAVRTPPGAWIRAGGYDETSLRERRDPDRLDLDAAAPRHPVRLTHRSGHVHVLNSPGLKCAGISRETPDPEGGLIERDLETAEPTGLLFGLGDLLSEIIPPLGADLLDRGVALAGQQLLSSGITTFQDASHRNDIRRWHDFERWKKEGALKCRAVMMLGLKGLEEYRDNPFRSDIAETHLRTGGVKIVLNETDGRLRPDQEALNEIVLSVHRAGLQACIHAIEETAVEAACAGIEYALQRFPRPDHRHRIEHCSLCPPDLARRIASLEAMVVTHPAFAYYGGDRYLKTVPPHQIRHLYPLSTLKRFSVPVAAGSDAPVAPVDPLSGIYAAVTGRTESGDTMPAKGGITVYEALRMYTDLAARSAFEEELKGTITPGKLADLTVLSADPTRVPLEEIKNVGVEMTILGGEVVYGPHPNRLMTP